MNARNILLVEKGNKDLCKVSFVEKVQYVLILHIIIIIIAIIKDLISI